MELQKMVVVMAVVNLLELSIMSQTMEEFWSTLLMKQRCESLLVCSCMCFHVFLLPLMSTYPYAYVPMCCGVYSVLENF